MSGRRRSMPKSSQGTSLLASAALSGAAYSVARSGHVLRTTWLCGCLLDTYRALRTVRSNGRAVGIMTRKKAMRDALSGWIIYIAIGNVTPVVTRVLEWMPLYTPLSTLVSVTFLFTRLQSSDQTYRSFVQPTLKRYETPIDLTILLIRSVVELVWLYLVLEPLWACQMLFRGVKRNIRCCLGAKEHGDVSPDLPLGPGTTLIQEEGMTGPSSAHQTSAVPTPRVHQDMGSPRNDAIPLSPGRSVTPTTKHTATRVSPAVHKGRPTGEPARERTAGPDGPLPSSRPNAQHEPPQPSKPKIILQPSSSNITVRRPRVTALDKRKGDHQLVLPRKRQKSISRTLHTAHSDVQPTRVHPTIQPSNALRTKQPLDAGAPNKKPVRTASTASFTKPPSVRPKTGASVFANGLRSVSVEGTKGSRNMESENVEIGGSMISRKPSVTSSTHRPSPESVRVPRRISPRKRHLPGGVVGLESKRKKTNDTSTATKREASAGAVPESKRRRVSERADLAAVRIRTGASKVVTERRRIRVYEDK